MIDIGSISEILTNNIAGYEFLGIFVVTMLIGLATIGLGYVIGLIFDIKEVVEEKLKSEDE